jgi:hypothetical protein
MEPDLAIVLILSCVKFGKIKSAVSIFILLKFPKTEIFLFYLQTLYTIFTNYLHTTKIIICVVKFALLCIFCIIKFSKMARNFIFIVCNFFSKKYANNL